MSAYDDKALLFITSTDARIPQGRNVRAQHRTKTARKAAPAKGEFATLDFRVAHEDSDFPPCKRQKRGKKADSGNDKAVVRDRSVLLDVYHRKATCNPTSPLMDEWTLPFINPADILSVATFHVRRMAVMSMTAEPVGLASVLRRRGWSCVPYAYNCFGKDPCVDSAILCVADRIRLLSGSPFSPLLMMKHYEKALRDLQTAINEPEEHHPQDVLAAVQLLAVYEMLDSLDNDSWSKHVAGATTMIQTYTTITPESLEKWESRGCGHALPMFGDALLKGDVDFFRTYPWRELLQAIFGKLDQPPEGIVDLMQCMRLMPSLLLDVDAALGSKQSADDEVKFGLLDRAHDIRYRMRHALCGNQLYEHCHYKEMLSSFDLLGTMLASLLALDRVISTLRPKEILYRFVEEDVSEELCTQLLQLELGASAQYPPLEVLSGFQRVGALDTAFDTKLSATG